MSNWFITAEHAFVGWEEKELAKLAGAAPKIEGIIDAGLKYINPAMDIALTLAGGKAAIPEVDAIFAEAQKDLLAASSLVYDFGPTPTAATIFASVKTNLSALLTAGHIKSDASVATVNKIITNVGALGVAVSTAASAINSAATTPTNAA